MVNALEAARKAAKKAHENLYYNGLCTIVEYGSVTDPETKRTTQKEITVVENQPCNLSFEKLCALRNCRCRVCLNNGTNFFK